MKRSHAKISMFLVLLTSVILLSTNASAEVAPYLFFNSGNYSYDAGTQNLSFTGVASDQIMYNDESWAFDPLDDPIIGAELSFGSLTNSTSNNLVFGPTTFTIEGFLNANVTDFVVSNSGSSSQLSWGTLNNIERLDNGSSRYIDELLTYGGGRGNIYISFTPTVGVGGKETFTSTSSGSVGATVAAPEPVSAILFLTGGAALAFRSYRKKRI